jgi:inner membrane protein
MRTGGMGEYILSGAVLLICSLVVFMQGLVDGAEWRARRFEWF